MTYITADSEVMSVKSFVLQGGMGCSTAATPWLFDRTGPRRGKE